MNKFTTDLKNRRKQHNLLKRYSFLNFKWKYVYLKKSNRNENMADNENVDENDSPQSFDVDVAVLVVLA